jgi:hypothetical protein
VHFKENPKIPLQEGSDDAQPMIAANNRSAWGWPREVHFLVGQGVRDLILKKSTVAHGMVT